MSPTPGASGPQGASVQTGPAGINGPYGTHGAEGCHRADRGLEPQRDPDWSRTVNIGETPWSFEISLYSKDFSMDCVYSVDVRMRAEKYSASLRYAKGVFYTDRCPAVREGNLVGVEHMRESGTKAFAREAAAYLLKQGLIDHDVPLDLMDAAVEAARRAAVQLGIRQVARAWGHLLDPSDVAAAWAEADAADVMALDKDPAHSEALNHEGGDVVTVSVDSRPLGIVVRISINRPGRPADSWNGVDFTVTNWGWKLGSDAFSEPLEAARQVMRYAAFAAVSDDDALEWLSGALVRATKFVMRRTFRNSMAFTMRLFEVDEVEDMVRAAYVADVHES